jgi:hypothetical protein
MFWEYLFECRTMNSGQNFFQLSQKKKDNSAQWRRCGGRGRRVLRLPQRQNAEGDKINTLKE